MKIAALIGVMLLFGILIEPFVALYQENHIGHAGRILPAVTIYVVCLAVIGLLAVIPTDATRGLAVVLLVVLLVCVFIWDDHTANHYNLYTNYCGGQIGEPCR